MDMPQSATIKDYPRTAFEDSVDKASMRLLKECFESASDKNVIASPLGVLSLLAMVSAGTEGETRDEIMQLLDYHNYEELEESYGSLTERFAAMDPSFLILANKIYVSDEFTLQDQFSKVVKQTYKNEVEQLDFKERKVAVDRINKWASENTRGQISSPVDANTFDSDTAAAMFNVIFFQGQWNLPFKAKNTKDKDFYVDATTTVKKPTMKLLLPLHYHEDAELGAKMIELPYKENGFRMIVVLPIKKDGLQEVVEKLTQSGLLEHVSKLCRTRNDVNLEMPKFDIKNSLDLTNILPKVGVSRIFSEGAYGVVQERGVKISQAFQQVFVKVDEKGATARAFAGLLMRPVSAKYQPPPPLQFQADHPFLFAILHQNVLLFTGCVYTLRRARYKPPPPLQFKVDHPFLFAILYAQLHVDIVLFTDTQSRKQVQPFNMPCKRRLAMIEPYTRTALGDSVDKASMRLLKECFESATDKNVISSPLGVLSLLAMVSAGTEGETRDEIMHLLNYSNYKELEESYGSLTKRFATMDSSLLVLSNKIYVSNEFMLQDQFSKVVEQTYKSEVEQLDFKEKKAAVDRINTWASEITRGQIRSPVDANTFDSDTAAAMFNVIFFQGQWNVPFKAKDTKEEDFYVDATTTVKKPMMKLQQPLHYHEDAELGAKMVELPYKKAGFRMVVVLPTKNDGLQEVVEKLAQRGLLEHMFELKPTRSDVKLQMPKFDIRNSFDLTSILPKVGVSRIFSEGAYGVVREKAVKISKAFQQAFVKVDEEGATAGAFTGCIFKPLSARYKPPPPLQFKVDHPFLYAILHEDVLLFIGTYTH